MGDSVSKPTNAKPGDAPVASQPTNAAPAVDPRIAELEAQLAAANARADAAEREALDALAKSAAIPADALMLRPYLKHTSIRFRGRDYTPIEGVDVLFPFDPQSPPSDVSGLFFEGVDYEYRAPAAEA